MKKVQIVADSTCDLSEELIAKYNIAIIPLCIIMDDKSYFDGLEVTPTEIFEWASKNKTTPKTSAISLAKAKEVLTPFMENGDDIIFSEKPVCQQMAEVYEKYGKCVVGVKPVSMEWIQKYSSLKVDKIPGEERVTYCTDMIEKPKPGQEFSNLSILGRVLLTPEIFDILDHTAPGAGNEIQLTDAIKRMLADKPVFGYVYPGRRHDIGNPQGYFKALEAMNENR